MLLFTYQHNRFNCDTSMPATFRNYIERLTGPRCMVDVIGAGRAAWSAVNPGNNLGYVVSLTRGQEDLNSTAEVELNDDTHNAYILRLYYRDSSDLSSQLSLAALKIARHISELECVNVPAEYTFRREWFLNDNYSFEEEDRIHEEREAERRAEAAREAERQAEAEREAKRRAEAERIKYFKEHRAEKLSEFFSIDRESIEKELSRFMTSLNEYYSRIESVLEEIEKREVLLGNASKQVEDWALVIDCTSRYVIVRTELQYWDDDEIEAATTKYSNKYFKYLLTHKDKYRCVCYTSLNKTGRNCGNNLNTHPHVGYYNCWGSIRVPSVSDVDMWKSTVSYTLSSLNLTDYIVLSKFVQRLGEYTYVEVATGRELSYREFKEAVDNAED